MVRRILLAALMGASFPVALAPAHASSFTDDLSSCLVDKTSPTDRVELVRWAFAALAGADSVKDMVKVTDQDREALTRQTANIFTRLITVDCRKEAGAAIKNDGKEALRKSFEVLGRIAVEGIVADPKVNARIDGIDKYLDTKALEDFARELGLTPPPAT